MSKYIEWFCVEMERLLAGKIEPAKVAEWTGEARAHLEESAADYAAQGTDPAEAEKRAVNEFGSPRDVAAKMLESIAGKKRFVLSHGVLWSGILMALNLYALVFVMSLARHSTSTALSVAAVLPPLVYAAIVWFVVASFRARTIQWRTIAVLGFAGSIVFLAMCNVGWFFGDGWVTRKGMASIVRANKTLDAQLEADIAFVNQGHAAFMKSEDAVKSARPMGPNVYLAIEHHRGLPSVYHPSTPGSNWDYEEHPRGEILPSEKTAPSLGLVTPEGFLTLKSDSPDPYDEPPLTLVGEHSYERARERWEKADWFTSRLQGERANNALHAREMAGALNAPYADHFRQYDLMGLGAFLGGAFVAAVANALAFGAKLAVVALFKRRRGRGQVLAG